MKKMVFLFFLPMLFFSCSNEPSASKENRDKSIIDKGYPEKIAKTWQFASFEPGEGLKKEMAAMFKGKLNINDSIDKAIQIAVASSNMMMNGATYNFRTDNSCTLNIMGQEVNGTYSFFDNYNEIIMQQRKGMQAETDTYRVALLNDSQLVLQMHRDIGSFRFRIKK